MARRAHPAAATRRLVAGLSTAATLGIVAAFGFIGTANDTAKASPTAVIETTPPPTIVQVVYRYVEVPAAGGAPSSGGRSTAPGSTSPSASPAPAAQPAPQPAPTPATSTKGS